MEIDLLDQYPRSKRPIEERGALVSDDHRLVARQFGKEFFDGERLYGYGGYEYHPRFWQATVRRFQEYYGLAGNGKVLDIGCAKGFMIHDMKKLIPGITVKGIDISNYAIENVIESMKDNVMVADARDLPFRDNSFDVVISITTVHNLDRDDCIRSLREIERVSRRKSFVTVDAYRNEDERTAMLAWNLTAKTILKVEEWIDLFNEAGYTGDYYWFMP